MKFLPAALALATGLGGVPLSASLSAQAPVLADERPRLPGRVGAGVSCQLADVNGDNLVDIVRVTAAGLDVLLQQVSGAFHRSRAQGPLPLTVPAGATVVSLGIGQLRRWAPGPDLVVGLSGADSLWLESLGGGVYQQSATTFGRGGFAGATSQVLVADLDGGNGDDVLVLHDGGLPQLFLQQANGGFALTGSNLPALVPQSPVATIGEFDGSRGDDIVLVQRGTGRSPVLFANNGAGVFAAVPKAFANWPAASYAVSQVRSADLNGDTLTDLVFTPLGRGSPLVMLRSAGTTSFAQVAVGITVTGVLDVGVGDLNSDRRPDLAILHQRGELVVSFQTAGGQFNQLATVLGEAARNKIGLVDLEGDGDLDLYALGRETEDRLLLGDGTGRLRDTEETTMPLGPFGATAAPALLAVVDASGDGDPDVVGYTALGAGVEFLNDGCGRFSRGAGRLPGLSGQVRDVQRVAASSPADVDLAVLLTPTVGSTQVRILVNQGGVYRDQTSARWPSAQASIREMLVGEVVATAGSAAFEDIIAIDTTGQLLLFVNSSGVYRQHPNAFAGAVNTAGLVKLALGDFNGDAFPDLVAMGAGGPPQVFLGSATGVFTQVNQGLAGSFPTHDCLVFDADGDSLTDVLVLAPPSQSTLYFFQGQGNGRLLNRSPLAPSPVPANPTSLALISGPTGAPSVIIGSSSEADVIFARGTAGWSSPEVLPQRGSAGTLQMLTGDLDVDGDQDLVLVRSGHGPRVLFNQQLQVTQLGMTQLGRPLELRLRAPAMGLGALVFGQPVRFPFSGWGVLRINPVGMVVLGQVALTPTTLPARPTASLLFPTVLAWPEITVPFQGVFLNGSTSQLSLTNCEQVELLRY